MREILFQLPQRSCMRACSKRPGVTSSSYALDRNRGTRGLTSGGGCCTVVQSAPALTGVEQGPRTCGASPHILNISIYIYAYNIYYIDLSASSIKYLKA
jgi:hypothetical protein